MNIMAAPTRNEEDFINAAKTGASSSLLFEMLQSGTSATSSDVQ
jgi:hypothetical protein